MNDPQNLNLLVVDDDEVDVQAIVRAVRKSGLAFGLFTAGGVDEALALLREETLASDAKPFLVLLDLNMPGRDGFSFLEELRRDPKLAGSIVFVLSTSEHEADRQRAYGHKVAGYLVKSDIAPNYDRLVSLVSDYASVVRMPDPRSLEG